MRQICHGSPEIDPAPPENLNDKSTSMAACFQRKSALILAHHRHCIHPHLREQRLRRTNHKYRIGKRADNISLQLHTTLVHHFRFHLPGIFSLSPGRQAQPEAAECFSPSYFETAFH